MGTTRLLLRKEGERKKKRSHEEGRKEIGESERVRGVHLRLSNVVKITVKSGLSRYGVPVEPAVRVVPEATRHRTSRDHLDLRGIDHFQIGIKRGSIDCRHRSKVPIP